MWKRLGALVVFPLQMIYLVVKAAVGLVLPAKLRDLSRENVLITGGGRGIGRQLAREFAERGARKVPGPRESRLVGAGGEGGPGDRGWSRRLHSSVLGQEARVGRGEPTAGGGKAGAGRVGREGGASIRSPEALLALL